MQKSSVPKLLDRWKIEPCSRNGLELLSATALHLNHHLQMFTTDSELSTSTTLTTMVMYPWLYSQLVFVPWEERGIHFTLADKIYFFTYSMLRISGFVAGTILYVHSFQPKDLETHWHHVFFGSEADYNPLREEKRHTFVWVPGQFSVSDSLFAREGVKTLLLVVQEYRARVS